ncbi:MAG TPA: hypothetical protein VHE80_08785 [Acidimicrobiales bacterium]|nr:hypothetical protein [Acidimicrobiales bacterium]
MDEAPEATQREVEEDAARTGEDPITRREALETDLMDKGASDEGEDIGEPTP